MSGTLGQESDWSYDDEIRKMREAQDAKERAEKEAREKEAASNTGPTPGGSSGGDKPDERVNNVLKTFGAALSTILNKTLSSLGGAAQLGMAASTDGASGGMNALSGVTDKLNKIFEPLTKAMGAFEKVTKSVVAPWEKFFDGLKKITGYMEKFVAAFDPGRVQVMELAFRDLAAVIGQAFAPALTEITQMIQELAAAFKPITASLGPVFGAMFDAITDIVSMLTEALKPAFEFLTAGFQVVAELFRGLAAVLAPVFALLKAFWSLVGPLLTGLFTGLLPVIQFFTRAVVLATAALMQMSGMKQAVKDMSEMLDPKKEKERERLQGFAAVQNVAL